ncbi:protein SLC31A2 isoform X2 [Anabrus simplex]
MHMSYWFDFAVGDFLFEGYTITSPSGLFSTCCGLASLAILFEGVKVYLVSIKQQHADTTVSTSVHEEDMCPNDRSSLLRPTQEIEKKTRKNVGIMLYEVMWYSVQNVLGYILMLAVMTFNGYFTIAVSLGATVGYFVFGNVLMEVGLRSECIRRPKNECPVCISADQSDIATGHNPGSSQQSSSVMTEVAQGLLQSVMMDSDVEPPTSYVTSVVQVHHVQDS